MKHLRIRAIILISWLVLFYNAERLLSPLNISSLAYIFVLVMGIITFISPRLAHISLWAIIIVPLPVFLAIKSVMGTLTGDATVVMTIIEVCAITLTTVLVHWVSNALVEFEGVIEQITIGHRERIPDSAAVGQGFIYREVRRARNHHRPLTVMAISVDEKTMKVDLDRMVREVQQALIKQYKLSGISKTLCDELDDCAVIVQDNDHFLVALPETTSEELPILIDRLRKQVSEQVGVDLRIGSATFPKDSFTFEGLVDKASREMKTDQDPQPFIELEHLSVKHHTS